MRFNIASGKFVLDYEVRKLFSFGAFVLLLAIGIFLACLRAMTRPR